MEDNNDFVKRLRGIKHGQAIAAKSNSAEAEERTREGKEQAVKAIEKCDGFLLIAAAHEGQSAHMVVISGFTGGDFLPISEAFRKWKEMFLHKRNQLETLGDEGNEEL